MKTYRPCGGLIIGGTTVSSPEYHEYGLCIDADGHLLQHGGQRRRAAQLLHRTATPGHRREEQEGKLMRKKVCLDPGHGVETPGKCSPDKRYFEHVFALDLARRMAQMLTRHGVSVTLTREDEHTLTGGASNAESYARVKLANAIPADLFVSIHSNAAGNDGWYDARGLLCITSAPGVDAGRNRAANAILSKMREAGILVRSNALTHAQDYIVLRETVAPAVIVEHGFHTSKEDVALLLDSAYRDKLAAAECKGILDYLGIAWIDDAAAAPWYAEDRAWVMAHGISDGTRPEEFLTRAEAWAMVRRANKEVF